MTEAPPRTPVVPLPRSPVRTPADPATQQRRRLHYTAAMAAIRVRGSVLPSTSLRRRQVWQVCSAARVLTSLGIRVDVVQPRSPWPRHRTHQLHVTNEAGLLGELALLTGVPRTAAGWSDVADRALPAGAPLRPVELKDAVACPVSIAYRTVDGPVHPRTLAEVVAIDGLVLEVRLHDALAEAGRAA